jgi:hypothetical protein
MPKYTGQRDKKRVENRLSKYLPLSTNDTKQDVVDAPASEVIEKTVGLRGLEPQTATVNLAAP